MNKLLHMHSFIQMSCGLITFHPKSSFSYFDTFFQGFHIFLLLPLSPKCVCGLPSTHLSHGVSPLAITLKDTFHQTSYDFIPYFFGSLRLRTEVLSIPSSTRLGFELMTSKSWQSIPCHWGACSNYSNWYFLKYFLKYDRTTTRVIMSFYLNTFQQ